MKVLVIGKGGREHSLVWRLHQSETVWKIFCASGNPGIDQIAQAVPIAPTDVAALVEFAKSKAVDLTVVGPEDPLAAGIVDQFTREGLKIFGPTAAAAQLETSKSFAKTIMREAGVPTAGFAAFDDAQSARRYVKARTGSMVVKADGLALGKGVVICHDAKAALEAIADAMERAALRSGGQSRDRRGVSQRRGNFIFRAVRRRKRDPARHLSGSQGGLRRRSRPQHRRDGRVFAGAAIRARARSARDARGGRADAGGDERARYSVSRAAVRGLDDRRRTNQRARVQRRALAIRNAKR